MRIIGGSLKGLRINPPKNLPVRPTTDVAKEGLFNILTNRFDIEGMEVLDLCSGTGNMSLEFASRGAETVTAVDWNFGCVDYLKKDARRLNLNITCFKSDIFKFLKMETTAFDLIFADPPYNMPQYPDIPKLVFERELLKEGGILIVEHQSMRNLSNHPNFTEQRKYGSSSFSFFKKTSEVEDQ